jgi:hypothetical protein
MNKRQWQCTILRTVTLILPLQCFLFFRFRFLSAAAVANTGNYTVAFDPSVDGMQDTQTERERERESNNGRKERRITFSLRYTISSSTCNLSFILLLSLHITVRIWFLSNVTFLSIIIRILDHSTRHLDFKRETKKKNGNKNGKYQHTNKQKNFRKMYVNTVMSINSDGSLLICSHVS